MIVKLIFCKNSVSYFVQLLLFIWFFDIIYNKLITIILNTIRTFKIIKTTQSNLKIDYTCYLIFTFN